jgi:DNA-binding MarR family transcriptional regulator
VEDGVGTLLLKDKQVRILSALANSGREWHLTDLAKETNVTYVHISKFIKRCEACGIVESERHGRIKKLVLTEKGVEVAKSVASIIERVNPAEPKPAQHVQK